jgi:predicted nucleotidyltransferase
VNREDVLTEFLTSWERRLAAHRAQLRAEAKRLAAGFARAGAQRVLLFGSTACGRAGFASDLDLVVVAPVDPEIPVPHRMRDVLTALNPRSPVDLLVYTPSEWERLQDERRFVREELAEKGVVLYERAG